MIKDGDSSDAPLRNRVEESGLIAFDLSRLVTDEIIKPFDLAGFLESGFVLKEKAFRSALGELNEANWTESIVALHCSTDAIIPDWAWMLVTSKLSELNALIYFGSPTEVKEQRLLEAIDQLDLKPFEDGRIVIKGCSEVTSPKGLARLIQRLQPSAHSIFYGEPCSTVPVYKRRKKS